MFGINRQNEYAVRISRSAEDLDAAQKLRYQVFNVELGEGLKASLQDERDADPFDDYCEHLLVEHQATQEIVGTYRLQTGRMAEQGIGYYSAREFDFSPYMCYRDQILELGRACIHMNHRKLQVLELLWRGIAQYALANGSRYLMGCSSLTSQNADEGWGLYDQLSSRHMAPSKLQTRPLAAHQLDPATGDLIRVKCPKLFRAYLSLGAMIASSPAMDREFKTIDYLTILDVESMRKAGLMRFFHKV